MGRFILRYQGRGPRPEADVARIRAVDGLAVLDETPRMLLVDADRARLDAALAALPAWRAVEERVVPLPDTKKSVE